MPHSCVQCLSAAVAQSYDQVEAFVNSLKDITIYTILEIQLQGC